MCLDLRQALAQLLVFALQLVDPLVFAFESLREALDGGEGDAVADVSLFSVESGVFVSSELDIFDNLSLDST